jgi:hypothetical protein
MIEFPSNAIATNNKGEDADLTDTLALVRSEGSGARDWFFSDCVHSQPVLELGVISGALRAQIRDGFRARKSGFI